MSKIVENLTSSKKRGRNNVKTTLKKKDDDKIEVAKKSTSSQSGQFDPTTIKGDSPVIYLGHIPSGFAETECRKFFAQFGKVRRVKVFRSKKSGRSKGYGFIQFEASDVAAVVAEAMDGYLLSDRQLVCHVVPVKKLHSGMFLPPKQKTSESPSDQNDSEGEDEEEAPSQKKIARLTRMQNKKRSKLKELGIDFDFSD